MVLLSYCARRWLRRPPPVRGAAVRWRASRCCGTDGPVAGGERRRNSNEVRALSRDCERDLMRTNAARKGSPALLLVIALVVLVSGSVAAVRLVVSSQHPPKITSFYPTVGTAGTVVTILGDFFESTDTVQFNAQRSASVRIISTTQ